ncbi:MAG TPA: restriction endonuclease [Bacteroidales bacterium]|nr:restriction endonuclease [Bacteroidales bacterium]
MIPDFQSLMLPFMNHLSDGQEHSTTETHDKLAKQFGLTEEELFQYLPSGNQKTFYNRLFWAKAHLKMAGLLENTKRGHFRITERGKQVIASKPALINLKFLKQFPDYLENSGRSRNEEKNTILENESEIAATPEETLESNYLQIRKNLALEILTKIKSCSIIFFENLVVELLVKMGYGGTIKEAGKSIGRSGDEGIDGIIKEDRLGLDVIYIQAKRWQNFVGRPEIQKFVGALAGQGAKKGVFITTSRFTNDAREYQPKNETKIVLIDGEQLSDLMIDFNLGVSITHNFTIKRIDNDFFEED